MFPHILDRDVHQGDTIQSASSIPGACAVDRRPFEDKLFSLHGKKPISPSGFCLRFVARMPRNDGIKIPE